MELNNRVTQLEDEIKILKGEIQAMLLDVKENLLNRENPFTPSSLPVGQPIAIYNQSSPPIVEKPNDPLPEDEPEEEAPPAIDKLESESTIIEPPKPVIENEPSKKMDTNGREQLTSNDVVKAWRPASDIEPDNNGKKVTNHSNRKFELATMVALAQWVDETVNQLGTSRTRAILDVSEVIGDISPDLTALLVKMIRSNQPEPCHKIIPRDYLKSLMELNNLLGNDDRSNSVLYSFYALCSTPGVNRDG